ncbi:MAG: HNH endonuclease family protein, partial [Firmicutes bacterium]|nr:HNH endonuclease family protein [Bacillota bacterium]
LENSLARYHWIVLTGIYNIYDVYRALKQKHRGKDSVEVLHHARDYVESLVEAANLYAGLRKPDLARFGAARSAAGQYFELLNDPAIGTMANFAPLLMAVFKRFMPGFPEDVCEVLRLCYLFSWRAYRVCNRRSDAGIGTLSSLAHRLWHGQTGLEEITASLKQLIEYYGGDNIFKDNLERNTLSGPERRYFLYRWELHLARQSGQSSLLDWKDARNMQVEHVWPQIPPDSDYGNWRPELKEKHTKIVDLLGNLILLDQSWNASLSNRLPSQKRDEYLNREKIGSNLAMVRELANDNSFEKLASYTSFGAYRTRWMLEDAVKFIDTRTKRLVEFALQEWKV